MRVSLLGMACLGLMGCAEETTELPYTVDVRVDQAGAANDPDSRDTRMCVNDDGAVFVVWVDDRDGNGIPAVWFNRSLDGGGNWLSSALKVNQGDGGAENPSIACTVQGVFVVWEDDRDGELENKQIYFNRSMNLGTTWEEEDVLLEEDPDGDTISLGPVITAVGADLYVAWFDSLNGAYDIFAVASGNQGTDWREPVRVDSDAPGEAHSASPQLAATEYGDVLIAWEDARNGKTDIYFARSENAATSFLDNVHISADKGDEAGSSYSFSPRMEVSGDNVYVVWHDDRNGEGRDILLQYSADRGKNWLVQTQYIGSDAAGFDNSLYADLAVDRRTAHVAWQDSRNVGYDIFYRQIESGVPGEEEVRVESDGPGFSNSVNARVALEGASVVVAWEDARAEAASGASNGYNDLFYNYSSDGGANFNESDLRIDSMAPGQSYKIDLNVEVVGGEVYSAWTDGRNGTADVFFQRHVLGDGGIYLEETAPQ